MPFASWPTESRPLANLALGASAALLVLGLPLADGAEAKPTPCGDGMVSVGGRFCIDQYEASTIEVLSSGKTRHHSPFKSVDKLKVKAISKRGIKPQAFINQVQAGDACTNAGKRLCTDQEWMTACRGRVPTTWPYGKDHRPGYCNDSALSPINHYYGNGGDAPQDAYTYKNMNDPRLNMLDGSLAPTGAFARCRNSYGVYNMVGNLHEWTAAQSGTFRGGFYLDTRINGEGCDYRTIAHGKKYHDYSTGFRCCR